LEHKNLSTDFILKLIYDLGYIIKTLEQQEKCIIGFSLRDIVILNGDTFMFVNTQKIVNVNSAGEGILKSPINLTGSFLHPDVDTNTLPIKFPKGLSNYSFGLFITFLLTNTKTNNISTSYNIEAKKDSSLLSSLNEIYGSKLYYFVLRCLDEKQFLYI
jgi:hypothetical protein